MSRKSTIFGFKAIDNVSAVSAQTSAVTQVGYEDSLSYHCKFSSASTGTFVVEACNDDDVKIPEPQRSWYAVDFGAPLSFTSETEVIINLFELPFKLIRLQWQPTAGAGNLTATLVAKTVGA